MARSGKSSDVAGAARAGQAALCAIALLGCTVEIDPPDLSQCTAGCEVVFNACLDMAETLEDYVGCLRQVYGCTQDCLETAEQ